MGETVLLCGVGGQGTILAAHILADVIMNSGLDVKVSEIHGMSQRGGAVTTVVRFGEEVHSMVCDKGQADVVVSFEVIEAVRNFDQLKIGGTLIVNDIIIKPASVLTGRQQIESGIEDELIDAGAVLIPAEDIAKDLGSAKASNVVLLGALSSLYPFDTDTWKRSISEQVPKKTIDLNLEAFDKGRSFMLDRKGE